MSRQKNKIIQGICYLCGLNKGLNEEHIPPKCCGNDHHSSLKLRSFDITNYKNYPHQGGYVKHCFCVECNRFLGQNYVKFYKTFYEQTLSIVDAYNNSYYIQTLPIYNIFPLRIIKQIFSMFLAVNTLEFSLKNENLVRFVANYWLCDLNPKYRIFASLSNNFWIKYMPNIGHLNLKTNSLLIYSEIDFPPIKYIFTTNYEGDIPNFFDITFFKKYNPYQMAEINLKLPVSKTNHLPSF